MEFEIPNEKNSIIKVIGVGGGGGNAVNHMYKEGIKGVDFVVCNTDLQALDISPVPQKIQLGPSLTEGRGAGSIPEIGKNAAVENIDEIQNYLSTGTKMVFVTAGMGGGTGTGAAPVIAKLAKDMGILTVGIVTVPFNFEGRKRRLSAEAGLQEMRDNVDTLLVINNERLREISGNLSIGAAFAMADNVLATAAKGIAEVIEVTGAINVDFNDVSTVMKDSGVAIMGSAQAEGDNRAVKCVQTALESPLLNDNDIEGAEYVLLNITYGDIEVTMDEIAEITDYIQDEAGSTADVIFGHAHDETLGEKLSVTIIATGFQSTPLTGFEKAPEKKVTELKETPKKEISQPLESATQPTENTLERIEEMPSIKEVTAEIPVVETPIVDETPVVEESFAISEELTIDFSESSVNPTSETQEEEVTMIQTEENENVTRFTLKDESDTKISLDHSAPMREISIEEKRAKDAERMNRIQEYTNRLKKSDGLQELENEPAFKRRKIELDQSAPSENENTSRFSITTNESGSSLSGNNSFLHDNVD